MWGRYKPVAILTAVFVLLSVIARLFGVQALHLSDDAHITVGLVFSGAFVLTTAVATYWWSVRFPLSRVIPEIGLAVIVATALILFVTVYIGNFRYVWRHPWTKFFTVPFNGGAGLFFNQIWQLFGCAIIGGILGLLTAMAVGQDYRAKQLKEFTKHASAKPRRVVRR